MKTLIIPCMQVIAISKSLDMTNTHTRTNAKTPSPQAPLNGADDEIYAVGSGYSCQYQMPKQNRKWGDC